MMKILSRLAPLLFLMILLLPATADAQQVEMTHYRVKAYGSVANNDETPFWMVSNRYGVVPLEAGNGYMQAGVFHTQKLGKHFLLNAGLDLVAVAPRENNVYIQQLYASLNYSILQLRIGSKEDYNSLWDRNLSSGDMIQSANARPIPEIDLSVPQFTVIPKMKGWLQFKGHVSLGRSFDTGYLEKVINPAYFYNMKTLWHRKSLYLRIQDTQNHFPLSLTLGMRHGVQFGGESTNPKLGKQPQSFSDFFRVFFGKSGGEGSSVSDSINALGNNFGTYDIQLAYQKNGWSAKAYLQHFFEDGSGMEWFNRWDGLWGLQIDIPFFPVSKVVFEILETRNQSGPFHFVNYDHSKYTGRGGGADSYYNNGEYTTGLSYFNRAIGNPMLLSPEYDVDGRPGFRCNRVHNLHLGLEGSIIPGELTYRLLATYMNAWGTQYEPYLKKRRSGSGVVEINYTPTSLAGWQFGCQLGMDKGSYIGDNLGLAISVSKTGIIKTY